MHLGKKGSVLTEALESRYWSAEQAEVVLAAWSEGEESLAGFARGHGLGPERLRRWKRRLAKVEAPVFHPVQVMVNPAEVPEPGPGMGGLELVVRGGRRVVVPPGFDPEHLRRVVRVVENWSC